jgi:glycosyltransferase involved in cell wall biosynthesis
MGAKPRLISVVLPVRNAAKTLPSQLEALAAQDYEGPWEVVIADNGSTDGSAALARRWAAELPPLRVVDASDRIGPSHARNRGAAEARGDFLAFCDADDAVDRGWLTAMAAAAPGGDLITGPLEVEALNDPLTRSLNGVRSRDRDRPLRGHDFLFFATSGNCGVWATVFRELGGFDERIRVGEDIDFSFRAQLQGYGLGFAREAVVEYRYRRGLRALAKQHYAYGKTGPELFRVFRGAGMPRPSVRRALMAWAWIVLSVPTLPLSLNRRGMWAREAAIRLGQLAGSVRNRVLYL